MCNLDRVECGTGEAVGWDRQQTVADENNVDGRLAVRQIDCGTVSPESMPENKGMTRGPQIADVEAAGWAAGEP